MSDVAAVRGPSPVPIRPMLRLLLPSMLSAKIWKSLKISASEQARVFELLIARRSLGASASAAVVTRLACCDAGWQADPEHAWFPEHRSPESITTATDSNRMISVSRLEPPKPCQARRSVVSARSFRSGTMLSTCWGPGGSQGPFYTVRCCAFNNIDMAAANFITSLGVARELGTRPNRPSTPPLVCSVLLIWPADVMRCRPLLLGFAVSWFGSSARPWHVHASAIPPAS